MNMDDKERNKLALFIILVDLFAFGASLFAWYMYPITLIPIPSITILGTMIFALWWLYKNPFKANIEMQKKGL